MSRVLDRYVFREIAATWFAVTLVLLLILLTSQFAQVLGDVAKGRLPRAAALEVIGLSAVQYLTILVPIGLCLSVMLALGRFYRDSEMSALLVPLTLAVGWLALDMAPRAFGSIEQIGAEARRGADLASIEPGRFTVIGPDNAVVYGERVTEAGVMENVFMQRRIEGDAMEVVVAERGEQVDSDDPDIRYLVLYNGRRYEGAPGTSEFLVVEFGEHGIPYRLPSLDPPEPEPRAMDVQSLIRLGAPEHLAELHWRLGVPLSTFLLGVLAVPLSKSRPRAGRYGRITIGFLVVIIYFNMMSAAKAWIEQGSLPPGAGLWWVHGAVLGITLVMLAVQNSLHRRLFR